MENLVFSLNAAAPVFLLMVLGLFFRKIGWIDEEFAEKMNKFVFRIPLPVLVFNDLASVDFEQAWNTRFVLFCFLVTILSITASAAISLLLCSRALRGEFIQASYRSSAALLGIAFIQNIYGTAGMAPMMIIGSVPLYNIMAVVVLSFFRPGQRGFDYQAVRKTLKGILTNPIILGIAAGLVWSAFGFSVPVIMGKTLDNIGAVAAPMGLMAMGASFDIKKASAKLKAASLAVFMKLVGFCAVFLPAAVCLGFRREELVAILVMLGSATTVSCYVMARNMGHEGVLSSSVVMLTTLFSAFTLTGWLYLLRSADLI